MNLLMGIGISGFLLCGLIIMIQICALKTQVLDLGVLVYMDILNFIDQLKLFSSVLTSESLYCPPNVESCEVELATFLSGNTASELICFIAWT